jgi:glycosyltransferase involved in cell wall biosynthesis
MGFSETAAPFFSVVVPTYNRPRGLSACLAALAGQDYPRGRYEVIVVDDGSPTPPAGSHPGPEVVRFLRQPHAGPAAARNHGAAEAGGDFLAFVDDDCVPEQGWLRALAEQLAGTTGLTAGGRTLNGLDRNPHSRTSQILSEVLLDSHRDTEGAPLFLCANNLAVPAREFRAAGGFATGFLHPGGEDWEFCERWRVRGGRLILAPQAVVRHLHEMNFRDFCRQHFHYGRGAFLLRLRRAKRLGQHVRLEPASFYTRLLARTLSQPGGHRFSGTALVATSQAATAAGFLWEALSGTGAGDS